MQTVMFWSLAGSNGSIGWDRLTDFTEPTLFIEFSSDVAEHAQRVVEAVQEPLDAIAEGGEVIKPFTWKSEQREEGLDQLTALRTPLTGPKLRTGTMALSSSRWRAAIGTSG